MQKVVVLVITKRSPLISRALNVYEGSLAATDDRRLTSTRTYIRKNPSFDSFTESFNT